jgi:hypothetical protein
MMQRYNTNQTMDTDRLLNILRNRAEGNRDLLFVFEDDELVAHAGLDSRSTMVRASFVPNPELRAFGFAFRAVMEYNGPNGIRDAGPHELRGIAEDMETLERMIERALEEAHEEYTARPH